MGIEDLEVREAWHRVEKNRIKEEKEARRKKREVQDMQKEDKKTPDKTT